ncbi:hypothetical protein P255_01390 [Acinetobacter brisouii CIP 110357]|uniref:Uncharacterized protein n=1 Tax=Acinetobacter brisouii CIP 110357 TaxID=1341683 RepID=V2UQM3_9GAMM|nr:hypothetical protein F954_02910 [Acinetobacter brisouii ANC 4119]ESK50891.1 hypothetical protein P255_01390 [Acinetobacter brisouii CIP 110357]
MPAIFIIFEMLNLNEAVTFVAAISKPSAQAHFA